MNKIEINTKFSVGDLVYGFAGNELHKLIIDRIEISLMKFDKNKPFNQLDIKYLATTTDRSSNIQYHFNENNLFTKDELMIYINDYLKNDKL